MKAEHYIKSLREHFESHYGMDGETYIWNVGPKEKLHSEFSVLEIGPNHRHNFWIYCTLGMSLGRTDDNLIELFVYSPKRDESLVELLTVCASYHRQKLPLNIHHTVNIGRPWLDDSICDHGFISLPYLEGEKLEVFDYKGKQFHCYWFIPITEAERDYKIHNGCELLEQLFESKQLDYLNPKRHSLVT